MQTGLNLSVLQKMMPLVAMLVSGVLAKQGAGEALPAPAATGGGSFGGLGGMLGGLVGSLTGGGGGGGQAAGATGGLGGLGSMLDMDGDGNPLNDIIGMAGRLTAR